jgi:hypothetical protein
MKAKNIHRDNYEIFFIDFFDGNLSEELTKELYAFLEENPDLKLEFQAFKPISLTNETVEFSFKEDLKKNLSAPLPIIPSETTEWLIDELENNLSPKNRIALEKALQTNQELAKERALIQKTLLKADKSIVFPDKEKLKKEGRTIPLYMYWSAAASVVLVLFFYWFTWKPAEKEIIAVVPEIKTNAETAIKIDTANVFVKTETNTSEKLENSTVKTEKSSTKQPEIKEIPVQKNLPKEPQPFLAENSVVDSDSVNIQPIEEVYLAQVADDETEVLDIDLIVSEKIKNRELAKQKESQPIKNANKRSLIALGEKAINKLTKKETKLDTEYNKDGEIYAFYFKSGDIEISKKKGIK